MIAETTTRPCTPIALASWGYTSSGLTRIAGFTSTRISSYTAESGLASPAQDFVAGAGGKSLDGRV